MVVVVVVVLVVVVVVVRVVDEVTAKYVYFLRRKIEKNRGEHVIKKKKLVKL